MMIDYPRLANTVVDITDVRASAEFYRQPLGLTYLSGHEAPTQGLTMLTGLSCLPPPVTGFSRSKASSS